MKRRPKIVRNITTLGSNVHYRQTRRRQDLIDKLISRFAFLVIVRRIVEFYRNHRRKIPIANREVEMLSIYSIEVRLPGCRALTDIYEIGQTNLCEDRVFRRNEALKDFVERALRRGKKILLA